MTRKKSIDKDHRYDPDQASHFRRRDQIHSRGVPTLLISISPFHIEFTPFSKTMGLLQACEKAGIQIFPWMQTFINDLSKLDSQKTHSLETMSEKFGAAYLSEIPGRCWIHLGGRALDTFRTLHQPKTSEQILNENPGSCAPALQDTTHFHVDLYKNYIPGLCAGIAIDMKDVGQPLPEAKYPLLLLLMEKGITGLFHLAINKGYHLNPRGYISKCDLCNDIRKYLFTKNCFKNELQPAGFYSC